MMHRAAVPIALMVGACGGIAVRDGDGRGAQASGGAAGAMGGGGSAVGGEAGTPSGGASSVGGGATGGGSAGSGGQGGGMMPGCPPTKPTGGACAPDGTFCDYGGFCNSATCDGGVWVFPLC